MIRVWRYILWRHLQTVKTARRTSGSSCSTCTCPERPCVSNSSLDIIRDSSQLCFAVICLMHVWSNTYCISINTVVYNGSLHDSRPPFLEDPPAPLSWLSVNRRKILSPTFIFPNNEPKKEVKASLVGSTSLIFAKISSPSESHYTCTGRTMKETCY